MPATHTPFLSIDDLFAIVKPHNDRLIAEGRLAEAERKIAQMLTALREVEEYLDDRADVDDGNPNDAMRHLVEVRAAIRMAEGR